MPKMSKSKEPIHVGSLLVRRTLSSSADYCARHEHYWRGYLCPWDTSKGQIGEVGKLIEVTSLQEQERERVAYRGDVDLFAQVTLAYYEVLDAGS